MLPFFCKNSEYPPIVFTDKYKARSQQTWLIVSDGFLEYRMALFGEKNWSCKLRNKLKQSKAYIKTRRIKASPTNLHF